MRYLRCVLSALHSCILNEVNQWQGLVLDHLQRTNDVQHGVK
jgi:hypothetical protein